MHKQPMVAFSSHKHYSLWNHFYKVTDVMGEFYKGYRNMNIINLLVSTDC